MAILIDAIGTPDNSGPVQSSTPIDMNGIITVGTGSNRALVVMFVADGFSNGFTPTSGLSVIWDKGGTNQAMTQIGFLDDSTGGLGNNNDGLYLYGLLNPTSGSKTIEFAWTDGNLIQHTCCAISFTGVNQSSIAAAFINGTSNSAGPSTTTSINVTSASGHVSLVLTSLNPLGISLSSPNQTQIYTGAGSNNASAAAYSTAGTASVNFTWTADSSQLYNNLGIDIVPAGSADPGSGGTILPTGATFTRSVVYQSIAQPVNFTTTTTVTWNDWTQWPDFAPKAKPAIPAPWSFIAPALPTVFEDYVTFDDFARRARPLPDFTPWTFVAPTLPTVYEDYVTFDDFARRTRPAVADFRPWTFVPAPVQVWYPPERQPDMAPGPRRTAQFQDWSYGTFVTPAFIPTWTAWTQWPDFVYRKKPAPDVVPWTFLEPPPQVWYPHDHWPDINRAKPRAADFPPFVWTPQTPAQVFFPYGPWDDFARRAKPAADFPYQALVQVVVPPSVVEFSWLQWPEITPKRARPVIEFPSFTIGTPPKQVFFPYHPWPDINRKKQPPLNYPFGTQAFPITTPWNDWTQWPDWVPRRSRPGIMTALQQFSAQWPGIITLVPVTGIMSAFEVDTDTGIFAINVAGTGPAVTAVVSIEEVGILLQGGNP